MRIPKIGSGRDGVWWGEWKRHMPVTVGLHLFTEISPFCDDRHMCRNLSFAGEVIIIGGGRWSRVVASTPATSSALSHLSLTSLQHVAGGVYTRTHAGSGQAPEDPTTKNCHCAEVA